GAASAGRRRRFVRGECKIPVKFAVLGSRPPGLASVLLPFHEAIRVSPRQALPEGDEMSRKPIPVLAFAVLCVLVLAAAGCGGKKKSASTATNAANTTAVASTPATTASTDTTASNGTP